MKVKSESEVARSCPTLSDPMDCSLPGSSVHGIFQARVLEWGAIAFSAPGAKFGQISPTIGWSPPPTLCGIFLLGSENCGNRINDVGFETAIGEL